MRCIFQYHALSPLESAAIQAANERMQVEDHFAQPVPFSRQRFGLVRTSGASASLGRILVSKSTAARARMRAQGP